MLFLLSSCTAAYSQSQSQFQIKGLLDVKKGKRSHWYQRAPKTYVYELEGTDKRAELPYKVKKVKDLRTEEQKHPIQDRVRQKVIFYLPIAQFGFLVQQNFKWRRN